MNANASASDDDGIARVFRENDNLGDDSSFWVRAARQLYVEQKPIGQMTLLSTGPTKDSQMSLGLFTCTQKRRLVFWPALSTGRTMESDGGVGPTFHHITLEFPKGRIHLTTYDANGEKVPSPKSFRAVPLGDSPLSVCWMILTKVDVLRNQDTMIQRKIQVAAKHEKRLTDWFASFLGSIQYAETLLAPPDADYDYVYYAIFLGPHTMGQEDLPRHILPLDVVRSYIDGWNATPEYEIRVTPFTVGECTLWIAAACPPGVFKNPVVAHFPRRRSQPSGDLC